MSVLFRTSDHQAEAMTKVEVSEVSPDDLLKAFVDVAATCDGGTLGTSRDEAMVVEHLVGLGRRLGWSERHISCWNLERD